MRINLQCESCGANRFKFPESGGDKAMILCDDCGHAVGTLGSLKAKVARAVLKKSAAKKTSKRSG